MENPDRQKELKNLDIEFNKTARSTDDVIFKNRLAKWNREHGRKILAFERTAIFQYVAVAAGFGSFLFLAASFFALKAEFEYRSEERQNWQTDRKHRIWSTLLEPTSGETGKGHALNALLRQGQSLNGLDLSCKGLLQTDRCANKPVLSFIDFSNYRTPKQRFVPYHQQTERNRGFSDRVINIDFSETKLNNLIADQITFAGKFHSAIITGGIISNTMFLPGTLTNTTFKHSDVSNVIVTGVDPIRFEYSWVDGLIIIPETIIEFGGWTFGGRGAVRWEEMKINLNTAISRADGPPICTAVHKTVDFSGETSEIYPKSREACPERLLKNMIFCDTKPATLTKPGAPPGAIAIPNTDFPIEPCAKYHASGFKHEIIFQEAKLRYPNKFRKAKKK